MVITKYIRRSGVIPKLSATTKPEALRELIDVLYDKKKKEDTEAALSQILARESTESTGIGRGIAVPHARFSGTKTLQCAVGRIPEGLDFMAVDRKPVHLIFLIIYPPNEQTKYLNFVATVARLLKDPEHLNAVLEAESGDAMYDLLESTSTKFSEGHEAEIVKKQKAQPKDEAPVDAHSNLILLARLQLCQEMLDAAKGGKGEIRQRIEAIRSLIDPQILRHYDRLMKSRAPALVSVEGDTCQGCFIKLASQFVQKVRQDQTHLHTCLNCKRYVYVV